MQELLMVVTLIIQIQNGQPVGSATGFFYEKNGALYLITNRHVVIDEAKGIKPDSLKIKLHTDQKDLTKNADLDIALYSNGVPKWHVHRDYATKKIDVAVIEIDQTRLKSGFFLKSLSASVFMPKEFILGLGEDVMLIGFPRGLADTKHNLPILRSAMISSAYDVEFQGLPLFLVDGNLHPGMSGSPVTTKAKSVWPTSDGRLKASTQPMAPFLGVFSATLNFNLPTGQQEQLGLGTVWYGYLIEEIIESFSKTIQ